MLNTDRLQWIYGILADEHQIQNEGFQEMAKRGWYQTQPAEQQKN